MTEAEDRIVPLLRNADVMDMPLVERTRWMTEELGRRFGGERAPETFQTLARADALIGRLVVRDFERRLDDLESKVRELETSR